VGVGKKKREGDRKKHTQTRGPTHDPGRKKNKSEKLSKGVAMGRRKVAGYRVPGL